MLKIEAILLCCATVYLLLFGQTNANINTCVRNCGQCKSMYGRFFLGTACADACLAGNDVPDCHDLSMVSPFLKWGSVPAVPVAPLGGDYEYYNVDGQSEPSGAAGLFRLLSARAGESQK